MKKQFFWKNLLLCPLFFFFLAGFAFAESPESPESPEPPRSRLSKFFERIKRVARHELGLIAKGKKAKENIHLEPHFQAQKEGTAFLEISQGIPILHLSGTPYQMGYDHGKILSSQIKTLNEHYLRILMDTQKKKEKAMAFVRKMEPFIPKDSKEEMRGMADGSGLPYENILFAHTFLDVYHSQIVACSTVGITQERSATGETLFGRNLDFPDLGFVHRFSMVIVFQPKGKPAFVSIAWPGLAGVLTGINEYGLSLGMMSIQFEKYNEGGFPLFWLFRHLLENCKNVPEALALLKKTKLSVASNLTLVDPKEVAVAELLPGNKRFRSPSKGMIYSVNHYQHPDIKKFIPSGTYTSSYMRGKIISSLLGKGPSKMDHVYVKKILAAVCIKGINLQSMVIIPQKKEILLGIGYDDSARRPFVTLQWKDLFQIKETKEIKGTEETKK